MQVLVVGSDSALGNGCYLMLDGVVHPWKDQVYNLGDFLDLSLLLDEQVAAVARSVFCQPTVPLPGKEGSCHYYTWSSNLKSQSAGCDL